MERVVVHVFGYVVEKEPVTEMVSMSGPQHIPGTLAAGASHEKDELVEARAPATFSHIYISLTEPCINYTTIFKIAIHKLHYPNSFRTFKYEEKL